MKRLSKIFRTNKKSGRYDRKKVPIFENLEPRLLLNADISGIADPLILDYNDNVIEVGLNSLILTTGTPQSVPYTQDFSSGLPDSAAGWEYYSDTAEGRIQVTGGRLRMDDTTSNSTFSLNEAILHLNLTGKTGVKLTLDHWNLNDDNDPLPAFPASFTNYKGDGIALSVDGINWVTV
ncbi:MAG: LEPR-XLL domain-containing protein, partial [Sedimentisphaerales bacterium]|nr:LEPR-XLL domain-containing protein [Sedimentisphaerales bacterium]